MQPMFVPSGNVYLIKGLNITNDYQHTIYFESEEQQHLYFTLRPHKLFNNVSYQRAEKGAIKLQAPVDELIHYSYMMFQNREFSDKWYYAFITNIEYVSNVTSKIYYQIDVIQTWMFDYVPASCMVLRQHTKTDNIGDNLVSENIQCGDYVYRNMVQNEAVNALSVVIMYNPTIFSPTEESSEFVRGPHYCGVYNGASYICIPVTENNMAILNNLINALTVTTMDGIISVFMMPSVFIPKASEDFRTEPLFQGAELEKPSLDSDSSFNDIDGYTPKNNKLFTYPYICANVQCTDGTGVDLAFEHFDGNKARFIMTAMFQPGTSGVVIPSGYDNTYAFIEKSLRFGPYPVCTWASDGFVNWFVGTGIKQVLPLSIAGASDFAATMRSYTPPATAPILNANSKSIVPVMPSTGITPAGAYNPTPYNYQDSYIVPGSIDIQTDATALVGVQSALSRVTTGANTHVSPSFDSLFALTECRSPRFITKTIRAFQAKIIDDYFTKYGYAINEIKIPNRHARQKWTYVKTQGYARKPHIYEADVREYSMPDSVWNEIVAIHDRGITYWDSNSIVGDYTQLNGIIEPTEGV